MSACPPPMSVFGFFRTRGVVKMKALTPGDPVTWLKKLRTGKPVPVPARILSRVTNGYSIKVRSPQGQEFVRQVPSHVLIEGWAAFKGTVRADKNRITEAPYYE